MFIGTRKVIATIGFLLVDGPDGNHFVLFGKGSDIDRGDTVDIHLVVKDGLVYPVAVNEGFTGTPEIVEEERRSFINEF